MNSAMNNEIALHYYCAIPGAKVPGKHCAQDVSKISWKKLKIGWRASSLFGRTMGSNVKDEIENMKAEELSSGRLFHISSFRFHISQMGNRAEIRRPHFALLGFEIVATPKPVQFIRAKEERIMDTMGELKEILEK